MIEALTGLFDDGMVVKSRLEPIVYGAIRSGGGRGPRRDARDHRTDDVAVLDPACELMSNKDIGRVAAIPAPASTASPASGVTHGYATTAGLKAEHREFHPMMWDPRLLD